MPASVKVYRYLASIWALKTLRERRLKVSRLKELNDPFEWRIGTIGDDLNHANAGREAFDSFVDRFNARFGIISLSAVSADPVIWSHYANSHKGIAFEFDHVYDETLQPVMYSHALPTCDVSRLINSGFDQNYTLSVLKSAYGRKSPSWAYEREYRLYYELAGDECEEEDGHYFYRIPDNFLSRVILGVRCDTTKLEVEHALAEGGFIGVEVVQARMSETTYEILCD